MTTLLPSRDLATLRAIARTAAVLLVAARINQLHPGRVIADYEIADILEVDKRTILKQLRSLSAAGLMLEQRPGWYVVTAEGQNTLFGWAAQISNQENLSIEATVISDELQNVRAQNVQFMMDEDDSVPDSLDSSSSIHPERTKCVQILEATHLLFGESVSTVCLGNDQKPKSTWVLAWVNKAWHDRERLSNPHGLIYRRIQARERPPLWLEKDPSAKLPDDFLDAIGMFEKPCPRCQTSFTNLAEHTAHVEVCLMTHVEEPVEKVDTRDQIWRHIVNGIPEIKGIAFHSKEKTEVQGNTLVVYLKDYGHNGRADHANKYAAPLASEIYAEVTGNKDAVVKFVAVEA